MRMRIPLTDLLFSRSVHPRILLIEKFLLPCSPENYDFSIFRAEHCPEFLLFCLFSSPPRGKFPLSEIISAVPSFFNYLWPESLKNRLRRSAEFRAAALSSARLSRARSFCFCTIYTCNEFLKTLLLTWGF